MWSKTERWTDLEQTASTLALSCFSVAQNNCILARVIHLRGDYIQNEVKYSYKLQVYLLSHWGHCHDYKFQRKWLSLYFEGKSLSNVRLLMTSHVSILSVQFFCLDNIVCTMWRCCFQAWHMEAMGRSQLRAHMWTTHLHFWPLGDEEKMMFLCQLLIIC